MLGRQLADAHDLQSRVQMTIHAFAERATGTLKLRVPSLRMFVRWSGALLPLKEQRCYEHMEHLRISCAPPTRAKVFLEAACLLAAVAGSAELGILSSSARLRGAAYGMMDTKRMRKQRDPL
eukprot:544616-Amphidinium_carterae.1